MRFARLDDAALEAVALAAGVEPVWHDTRGVEHRVPRPTLEAILEALGVDPDRPAAAPAAEPSDVAGEPLRALGPDELGLGRAVGVACQVYGLRSERNLGVGDLEDVARFAEVLAPLGVDALALSPLHARFPLEPGRVSPYAPSNRRFLDPMLLAVDRAAAQLDLPSPEVPEPAGLRAGELVDHPAVARAKGAALGALWRGFRHRHLGPEPSEVGAAFLAWREAQGAPLERFCRFEALALVLARASGRVEPWWRWPAELRRPDAPEVERLARGELAPLVAERAFSQWLLDRQLADAQARARAAGMRIGLATDLAVGVTPDSADAWAEPGAILRGVSIGAPPDAFAPEGQCWNLAPISPAALRANGLEPFLGDLEAAMRPAGLVRIDHVMGLCRQYWVPEGARPAEGAYVRFPETALLAAVANRSRRRHCLVQGEDLGTLPTGFRDRLAAWGFLSSRVLWFERWPSGLFKASSAYPPLAVASVSTHDLPTARGWLLGRDIDWRERVGQLDPEAAAAARAERARDRRMLLDALAFEGLVRGDEDEAAVVVAMHRMLGRTPSALLLVQLDDLVGAVEQANLPGTVDEHPNWRRRCPLAVEAVARDPLARRLLEAVRAERPG